MSFQGAWGLFSALFTGVGPSRPSRGCRAVWQRLITNTKAPFSSEASRLEYVQQPAEGGLRGIRKLPPKARPSFASRCPCSPSSQVPSPKEPPEGAPPTTTTEAAGKGPGSHTREGIVLGRGGCLLHPPALPRTGRQSAAASDKAAVTHPDQGDLSGCWVGR